MWHFHPWLEAGAVATFALIGPAVAAYDFIADVAFSWRRGKAGKPQVKHRSPPTYDDPTVDKFRNMLEDGGRRDAV